MKEYEPKTTSFIPKCTTWQWTGLDLFQNTDKQGHSHVDKEASVTATNDGYFDLIQLNEGEYHIQTTIVIAQAIEHSKKYTLIATIPFRDYDGIGYFWVWRKL